jgi:hypothetical protein
MEVNMNKETLQEYNTRLAENNTSLDDILTTVNNLPDASSSSGGGNVGTVLFGGDGTPDSVTLNDDVSNYEYIEIFFRCNAGFYNSIKIHQPNGKKAVLTVIECNDSDNYFMNYKSKNVLISENTIINQYSGEINYRFTTKSIYSVSRSNVIYIDRVVGYK